jgi:hypothetical protein
MYRINIYSNCVYICMLVLSKHCLVSFYCSALTYASKSSSALPISLVLPPQRYVKPYYNVASRKSSRCSVTQSHLPRTFRIQMFHEPVYQACHRPLTRNAAHIVMFPALARAS